jgi:hypothetical protein
MAAVQGRGSLDARPAGGIFAEDTGVSQVGSGAKLQAPCRGPADGFGRARRRLAGQAPVQLGEALDLGQRLSLCVRQ